MVIVSPSTEATSPSTVSLADDVVESEEDSTEAVADVEVDVVVPHAVIIEEAERTSPIVIAR
jgi:hypothetical protein